jgi:hypothetical protein
LAIPAASNAMAAVKAPASNWYARLFRHLTLTADGERLGAAARAIRRKATDECS